MLLPQFHVIDLFQDDSGGAKKYDLWKCINLGKSVFSLMKCKATYTLDVDNDLEVKLARRGGEERK